MIAPRVMRRSCDVGLGEPEIAVRSGGDRERASRRENRKLRDCARRRDAADLVALQLREPEVTVGPCDDIVGKAAGGWDRELRDESGGRDPSDLVRVLFREPDVAVGPGAMREQNEADARHTEVVVEHRASTARCCYGPPVNKCGVGPVSDSEGAGRKGVLRTPSRRGAAKGATIATAPGTGRFVQDVSQSSMHFSLSRSSVAGS